MKFDFAVIGAGIVGCSIGCELSRYNTTIAVIDKESDVGLAASTYNSGVIHSGYAPTPGTLKARLNVKAIETLPAFVKELNVPFKMTGKLLIACSLEELNRLERMFDRAKTNGVRNVRRVKADAIKGIEPLLDGNIKGALYFWDAGIISADIYVISVAENAYCNGTRFLLNSCVKNIRREGRFFKIALRNNDGDPDRILYARWLINSAGVCADEISQMAGARYERIHPQKGAYYVLDGFRHMFNTLVYPVPPLEGSGYLGTHITPTIDGHTLIGPSGEYVKDKQDSSIDENILKGMLKEALQWSSSVKYEDAVSACAGVRAKITPPGSTEAKDFIIEKDKKVEKFINLIGIDSPGLTCANEIAKYVVRMIQGSEDLREKRVFLIKPNEAARIDKYLGGANHAGRFDTWCNRHATAGRIRNMFHEILGTGGYRLAESRDIAVLEKGNDEV